MVVSTAFPMPGKIEVDEASATDTYSKFMARPFQSGFGHTLGNAMRRVLLSSLEGYAISAVRIDGVSHEFTTAPNVVEDVTEIVLNLKKIHIKCQADSPKMFEIRKDKAGTVTAGNIVSDGTIEILNPEQVICTLDKDIPFRAEIEISKGKGWSPAENNKKPEHPLGTIPIDALYSPVTRVNYNVGAARVGEETEKDSLAIEIWTDGRIAPKDALENSAKILQDHLRPFLGFIAGEDGVLASISEEEKKLHKILVQNVDNIELSVRAQNCLRNANIKIIGELCSKTESRMLKFRNFGKKSLDEIKVRLDTLGLSLGMTFSEEMQKIIETEAAKYASDNQEA